MKQFFTPFRIILILVMLLAVGTAVFCLVQLDWSGSAGGSHADYADYNKAATTAGLSGGKLSENEVLILWKSETHSNDNLTASFRIYAVPQGREPGDFYGLSAQEAEADADLTLVGSASAVFMGGNPKNIRDLTVSHDM